MRQHCYRTLNIGLWCLQSQILCLHQAISITKIGVCVGNLQFIIETKVCFFHLKKHFATQDFKIVNRCVEPADFQYRRVRIIFIGDITITIFELYTFGFHHKLTRTGFARIEFIYKYIEI